MRIGYGYNRRTKDLLALDCERVFVDTPKTKRAERFDLFQALRAGDTLVLLRKGDLGYGRELSAITARIEEMGVTLHVHEPVRDPTGRPPKFRPTDEQLDRIEVMWRDPLFDPATVLVRAAEIVGHPVEKHHLEYRLGARGDKRRPKR